MHDDSPTPSAPGWIAVGNELLARYQLFELHRSTRRSPTTGRDHSFLRLLAPDWVNVVPVTAAGELILVDQYRHGTDRATLEIPGGTVDAGEDPATAAARELEEETGYRSDELHLIGSGEPNPAFLSNTCWTYLALGCTPDGVTHPDPSEEITVRRIPLSDFTALIDDGTIGHALVIAAHDHLQRGLRRQAPWAAHLGAE